MRAARACLIAAFLSLSLPALAQQSTYLMFGPAVGNLRHRTKYGYASVEARHLFHSWGKLSIGFGGTLEVSRDEDYIGPNLTLDYRFTPRWGAALTSGPGWYSNHSLNLGSHLEFRSGLELFYFFHRNWRNWRIAAGIFHYSNAGVALHNPGTESVRIAIVIPL
ncbi:MAG: acyloxyacyl hydrolase [Acidobacteriota bacterium]